MPVATHHTLTVTVPIEVIPTKHWEWLFAVIREQVETKAYGYLQLHLEAGRIIYVVKHETIKPPSS